MHHESTLHEQNCFITLTYANAPKNLDKRHVQLFIKRLRKLSPVRYFACGEYGTTTRRPHYHAILFGRDYLEKAVPINDKLYTHADVLNAWGHGHISIAPVTLASCMYVAGYVNKKIADKDTFNLMSRRPGIGHQWLDKWHDDIARTETIVIEGKEFPIPKKYLEWSPTRLAHIAKSRRNYLQNLTPDERQLRQEQCAPREAMYKARERMKKSVI